MSLLTNPGFNQGHHRQDNIPELVVPDGWQLYYIDDDTFPGCGNPPAFRPETVVWNIKDAPAHEQDLFFLDGDYCLKAFKAHAPVYFALTQVVSGLTPDARYRFTANVYPDIVKGYQQGKKVRPSDIWHAEARVGWSDPDTPWPHGQDGDVNWAEWFNVNNGNFEFGAYNEIWQEFKAPAGGEVRVWLECKAKWGDAENNWFMDAFSLVAVEPTTEPDVEPEVEPTPVPTEARGAPRVQYARTYVLLPGNFPLDMVLAAARAAHDAKATVGFSADDAGIGDLDQRRVVCASPDQIGTGLSQAWYDEHYPGVEFVAIYAASPIDLEDRLRALL